MSPFLVLGLFLVGSAEPLSSRLPIAVIAPEMDTTGVAALLRADTAEQLEASAAEHGYILLDGPSRGGSSPYRLAHADYLDNSQYVFAMDVLGFLKGFDPSKAVRFEDFPFDLRRRLEPLVQRWVPQDRSRTELRFCVQPVLRLSVESGGVRTAVNPPPGLSDLLPVWSPPPMHPLTPGYEPQSRGTTLPNPDHVVRSKAVRALVNRSVVAFANCPNDQQRVRWAQELWKAVGDRVETQRQAFVGAMRDEARRALESAGAMQGFANGRAKLANVTSALRGYVAERVPLGAASTGNDVALLLRGADLAVTFELGAREFTTVDLAILLSGDGGLLP